MTDTRFFEQFIEDYFAECDEHLATMRRVLLALDNQGAIGRPAQPQVQELSRALHTVKGLSGMVGLIPAERVAHAMEDALRAEGGAGDMSVPLLEALFSGVRHLERCIGARRAGEEPPPVDAFVADLGAAFPVIQAEAPGAPQAVTGTRAPTERAGEARTDTQPYVFQFVPSTELAKRGVGVAGIRARLAALGDLIEATPRVGEDGAVVFDFRVAVRPDAVVNEAWRADGLSWSVHPAPERAPAMPERAARSSAGVLPAAEKTEGLGLGASSSVVRVELSRLDELMRLVGDLVISRARFDDALRRSPNGTDSAVLDVLQETNAIMDRQLRNLREGVTRLRLVPIGEVFERMRFALREVARDAGKQVALDIRGQDTEIDKVVVDRMLEPLLHLVRNAASHGIETPAERLARGKPAEGRITLSATAAGDRITIEVEDDGAGVDVERVASRARTLGILAPDEPLADDAILDAVAEQGLSTRENADLTSGRGVGMAVVRSTIRALGGRLALDTAPGRGTRFTIELPLTLMIVDALIVDIGGQRMAMPQPALREILQVERASITRFENNEVMAYRGGVLPLVSLHRVFGMPEPRATVLHLLVVGGDMQAAGLLVDGVVGLREIVVQPMPDPLVTVPGIAGATQLGDGQVSLILDAAALVRIARERRARPRWAGALAASSGASSHVMEGQRT